jgi:hypothetical protein
MLRKTLEMLSRNARPRRITSIMIVATTCIVRATSTVAVSSLPIAGIYLLSGTTAGDV